MWYLEISLQFSWQPPPAPTQHSLLLSFSLSVRLYLLVTDTFRQLVEGFWTPYMLSCCHLRQCTYCKYHNVPIFDFKRRHKWAELSHGWHFHLSNTGATKNWGAPVAGVVHTGSLSWLSMKAKCNRDTLLILLVTHVLFLISQNVCIFVNRELYRTISGTYSRQSIVYLSYKWC